MPVGPGQGRLSAPSATMSLLPSRCLPRTGRTDVSEETTPSPAQRPQGIDPRQGESLAFRGIRPNDRDTVKSTILPLLVAALFCLSGCQTVSEFRGPVPPLEVGEDAATIVFIRPYGPPAAVRGQLILDGQAVGNVFVRRYSTMLVEPGRHQVRYSFPLWVGISAQAVDFECRPRETYYIVYTNTMGVGAVYPGTVVFSVTPDMRFVTKDQAKDYLSDYLQDCTYGRKRKVAVRP